MDTDDAAKEALVEGLDGYYEMDDQEELDEFEEIGLYNYNRIEIEDNVGRPEFKYIYTNLISEIKLRSFDERRIFCQKMLDKIFEVYDYQFPEKVDITSNEAISRVLEFIEFLEYDNIPFLSLVWEMLKVDIIKINIELFCHSKEKMIIKEVEEQIETHHQNELITLFLRTYIKDRFIEWFIRESENSKTFIKLEILEREGKLNG